MCACNLGSCQKNYGIIWEFFSKDSYTVINVVLVSYFPAHQKRDITSIYLLLNICHPLETRSENFEPEMYFDLSSRQLWTSCHSDQS